MIIILKMRRRLITDALARFMILMIPGKKNSTAVIKYSSESHYNWDFEPFPAAPRQTPSRAAAPLTCAVPQAVALRWPGLCFERVARFINVYSDRCMRYPTQHTTCKHITTPWEPSEPPTILASTQACNTASNCGHHRAPPLRSSSAITITMSASV